MIRIIPSKYRNVAVVTIGTLGVSIGLLQISSGLVERGEMSGGKSMKAASVSQEVVSVDFCELLKTPFSYDSRVIRVTATLARFRNYVTFYSSSCVPRHPLIKVTFSPSFEHDRKGDATDKLLQIVSGGEDAKEENVRVSASAVGLFKAIPSEKRRDFTELQYEFIVTKIDLRE